MLPPRRGGEGLRTASQSGNLGDFYGVRKWQSGDNVKHIHWRTTARIGEPAVRQLEHRPQPTISIVVDAFATDPSRDERLLEFAVTVLSELTGLTAEGQRARPSRLYQLTHFAVADRLGAEEANQLRLFELETAVRDGLSDESRRGLLKRLATTQSTEDPAALIRMLAENAPALMRTDLVILSTRSVRQFLALLASMDPSSEAEEVTATRANRVISFLNQRNRLTWLNLSSQAVSRWIDREPQSDRPADATSDAVH